MNRIKRGGEIAVKLPNGLVARLIDDSRPIVGDRSQVVLRLELKIQVQGDDPASRLVREVIGPELTYTHKYERNFIDDTEVDDLLDSMAGEFETGQLPYLSRPGLEEKYIASQAAQIKRMPWKHGLTPEKVAAILDGP